MLYRFASCVLNSDRFEFSRDEVPVHLEPQVFDLLLVLVREAGTLVTRDRLIETVWQGLNVSDATVSARIAAARKAVGDSGRAQRVIRTIHMRGIQLVAPVTVDTPLEAAPCGHATPSRRQSIRFADSRHGAKIAFSVSGSGPPLMRIGHWLSHLEMDWQSPVWQPLLAAFSRNHTLYRYDQRGTGLSSRHLGAVALEDFVADLSAVADAAKLERFPIFAASQAVPVALRFAAEFPERVSCMVLYGGFAIGRALRPSRLEEMDEDTILGLIRAGWGKPDSPFVQAFSTLFVPDATPEQYDSLIQMQMHSVSPEGAAMLRGIIDRFSVVDLLETIQVPTLVIHADADAIQPLTQGRILATTIPNARFVLLESRNHVPLPQEAAWQRLVNETLAFFSETAGSTSDRQSYNKC